MNEIAELEKLLAEKKKEQQLKDKLSRLYELKDMYENTAYVSHKLSRHTYPGKGITFTMIRIYNFREENGRCKYAREQFSYNVNEGNFNSNVYTYNDCSIDDFTGMSTVSDIVRKKYQISLDEFENIKAKSKGIFDDVYYEMRKGIKHDDIITNGDHNKERTKNNLLVQSNTPFIELEGLSVLEVLVSVNHPLLIGTRLLVAPTTKKICENICTSLLDHARIWGGSISEYDYKKVGLIRDFLKDNADILK